MSFSRALLLASLLTLLAILTSCAIIPTQHGKVQLWGDYEDVKFDDGSVHFQARRAIHSGIVRAHWHGANNLAAEVVAGAIGLKGGNQVLGAASAIVPPAVNRPTTRATPFPR